MTDKQLQELYDSNESFKAMVDKFQALIGQPKMVCMRQMYARWGEEQG